MIGAESRRFCCPGCRAVAELIAANGLDRYYDLRTAPGRNPGGAPAGERPWAVCDRPEVRRRLVRTMPDGTSELSFRVDGMNCAACAWLIDRGLGAVDGIDGTLVNPVLQQVRVRFDPARVTVSAVLDATGQLGFMPRIGAGSIDGVSQPGARDALKRLAVAGLGFAQVMMLSAALYLGAFKAMDPGMSSFFEFASMLIATPVVLYAGAPMFRAALAGLMRRHVGMDVPVSLAILIALGASLFNAFRGDGPVYFDSATMFVFFLTLGRYLEARARHAAGNTVAALADLKPLSAMRYRGDRLERVGTVELETGDRVVVAPGESVPADGTLASPDGRLDEALLSGESRPRRRSLGERVLGGSLNVGQSPIDVRIVASPDSGYIEQVGDLLVRAMDDRPDFLRLADRWASVFVGAVLVAATATGIAWSQVAPERAVEIVLAMLVVTCPCALSLAAPTAYAVALGRLARIGLMCRSARVLERIADVSVWMFDKTGTLTEGRIDIVRTDALGALPTDRCIEIAAALEAGIEHPIAHAFVRAAAAAPANGTELRIGFGVTGDVDGVRYRLGSARHAGIAQSVGDERSVYLSDSDGPLARFVLADRLRPFAADAVRQLASGADVQLISGDDPGAVSAAAHALGLRTFAAMHTPVQKLERLGRQQSEGAVVAAVGDGVNDAPFLAQADVSVAMVEGSQLAQAGADVIFTGDDLRTLASLPAQASMTRRIVRQNLAWAVCYNAAALPLAAAGVLTPWMAALGMSLSSIVVVLNALRLGRQLNARRSARAFHAGRLAIGSGAVR